MTLAIRPLIIGCLAGTSLLMGLSHLQAQDRENAWLKPYSILGISLGDTAAVAKEKFEGDFEFTELSWNVEVVKQSTGASFKMDYPATWKGGTMRSIGGISTGPVSASDGMEVLLSTPETGGRVVAMTRTIGTAPNDNVPLPAFLKSLKAKYGEPSFEDSEQIAWLHDENGRKVKVSRFDIGATQVNEDLMRFSADGVPTCWRILSGDHYGLIRDMPAPYKYASKRSGAEGCGGGLYVRFSDSHRLGTAQFLAVDNLLLEDDRAAMDKRVVREISAAPSAPTSPQPKL